jgi:hypothetical protein
VKGTTALIAIGALAFALPATAAAQAPAAQRTITAVASGAVKVQRPAKLSSPTIAAAVEAAREKAGPLALANAHEEAQRLAAAAGVTLGDLQSISEQSFGPYGYGPFGGYGLDGTFGPGKYCGTIRTPIFRRTKSGGRIFAHRFRTHFGCRVPGQVVVTLSATYAVS